MCKNPIGIFDSGIGGTSIWREIQKVLPHENTIYLADNKNAPYGTKDKQTITELSIKNTKLLVEKGCKIIVIACNTATTNSIQTLRELFHEIAFIGVEPAIKPAALQSKTKNIGILATKGTLNSTLFFNAKERYQPDVKIHHQIGEGLVDLIENGKLHSLETKKLLTHYLTPFIEKNVDYLVLGCTHYPYLIPQIQQILPQHIQITDSGKAVAKQVERVLINKQIANTERETKKNHLFYTNKKRESLLPFIEQKYQDNIYYLDF